MGHCFWVEKRGLGIERDFILDLSVLYVVSYVHLLPFYFFYFIFLFIYDSHTEREREREREAETQAEGEAGSMHGESDVGFDPGSPGSRPGPKAGAKPLCHPGIPKTALPEHHQ